MGVIVDRGRAPTRCRRRRRRITKQVRATPDRCVDRGRTRLSVADAALPGPPSHWSCVVATPYRSPGSQSMSCRTDRAMPTTVSPPAQAINVIAAAPGERR